MVAEVHCPDCGSASGGKSYPDGWSCPYCGFRQELVQFRETMAIDVSAPVSSSDREDLSLGRDGATSAISPEEAAPVAFLSSIPEVPSEEESEESLLPIREAGERADVEPFPEAPEGNNRENETQTVPVRASLPAKRLVPAHEKPEDENGSQSSPSSRPAAASGAALGVSRDKELSGKRPSRAPLLVLLLVVPLLCAAAYFAFTRYGSKLGLTGSEESLEAAPGADFADDAPVVEEPKIAEELFVKLFSEISLLEKLELLEDPDEESLGDFFRRSPQPTLQKTTYLSHDRSDDNDISTHNFKVETSLNPQGSGASVVFRDGTPRLLWRPFYEYHVLAFDEFLEGETKEAVFHVTLEKKHHALGVELPERYQPLEAGTASSDVWHYVYLDKDEASAKKYGSALQWLKAVPMRVRIRKTQLRELLGEDAVDPDTPVLLVSELIEPSWGQGALNH